MFMSCGNSCNELEQRDRMLRRGSKHIWGGNIVIRLESEIEQQQDNQQTQNNLNFNNLLQIYHFT